MRIGMLMAAGAMLWQSPLQQELQRLEAQRPFAERWPGYEGKGMVAVVYKPGRPLTWVSVFKDTQWAPPCDATGYYLIFALDNQMVWSCKDGSRAPLGGDYAVVLTEGPATLIEWKRGDREETPLR